MSTELINFPAWGNMIYRDSGEGGLFVMLLVPEPEGRAHRCHVDVSIQLGNPDVIVHPRRDTFWDRDPDDRFWAVQQKVCDFVRDAVPPGQPNPMWRWAATARGAADLSLPFLAALHLGSISQSLYSGGKGYWYGEYPDLTDAGKALYNGLKAAYGVEPIIATFLDT